MKQIAVNNDLPEVPLAIDYSKNQEDVYREAIIWIIKESTRLGVLCLLQPDRLLSVLPGHYSWVPDLSSPPIQPLRLFTPDASCHTNTIWRSDQTSLRPSYQSQTLSVHAKVIGTIASIGDSSTSMIVDGTFEQTARLLLRCPLHHGSPQSQSPKHLAADNVR